MYFNNITAFYLFLLFIPIIFLIIRSLFFNRSFEEEKAFQFFKDNSSLPSFSYRIFINVLFLFTLSIIIIGLADPYIKLEDNVKKYQNIRLFFLVDVSGSMTYAEDMKPNRISVLRKELKDFYTSLDGEYEISIIPFSGVPNPYYCPLSYKSSVILPLIKALDHDVAPSAGTDISAAIVSLEKTIIKDKLNKDGINLIILLSDGGKEEFNATNKNALFDSMNKIIKNSRFYVVGIGGDVPTPLIKRDEKGGFVDYIRNPEGKISYSLMDETILKTIADKGNGMYIRFDKEGILPSFLKEAIQENRVPIPGDLRYKSVRLQAYLFGFSVIFLSFIYFFLLKTRSISK